MRLARSSMLGNLRVARCVYRLPKGGRNVTWSGVTSALHRGQDRSKSDRPIQEPLGLETVTVCPASSLRHRSLTVSHLGVLGSVLVSGFTLLSY